jgi:hypothetical protein
MPTRAVLVAGHTTGAADGRTRDRQTILGRFDRRFTATVAGAQRDRRPAEIRPENAVPVGVDLTTELRGGVRAAGRARSDVILEILVGFTGDLDPAAGLIAGHADLASDQRA